MAAQSDVQFFFRSGEGSFDVVRFNLVEGLSQPFRLELELSSLDANVVMDSVLDSEAVFTIARDNEPVRTVVGIVAMFEQAETGFRRTRYRALVEPALSRLGLWHGSRIHQQIAVPEILSSRLKERGLTARLNTSRSHVTREYCVQHRETDLAFFARMAAEEGFLYYFDANTQSQLVLTDVLLAGPRLPGADDIGAVAYQPNSGGDAREPRLWHFALRRQLAPARAIRRDYTFKNPSYNLEHVASARDAVGQYEHYDAPGRYKRDEAGKAFTLTKLQGLRSEATVAMLEGDDARLWPGMSFLLEDHPAGAMNRDWRVIAMHHTGRQAVSQEEDGADAETGTHYSYAAQAVPGDVEWRPAPLPRPMVDGPQIAHVVGPENEEIHVDEHGRVQVWFPWDKEGPRENSTCWVRVSQGWAGPGYGMMVIPRVGHELIVSFLDGDPDQPIVTGRAYHATNRPPYNLPLLKTLSTLKSQEHKGDGHNELLIDDTSGEIKTQLHSSHATTQLNMGFLLHPRGADGRGVARGEGFELRSDEAGALRSRTLLLSTYARQLASGTQLDAGELLDMLHTLADSVASLLDTAAEHQAPPAVHTSRNMLLEAVEHLGAGANDRPDETGAKSVIAMSAPDGIVAATPQTVWLGAGENVEAAAQRDASVTAAQQIHITAGKGIGQFAFSGGITQIAHRDDVSVQAQHGNAHLLAAETVFVSAKNVVIQASERLTTMCAGAYQTMEGGNIEMGCPGTFSIKAKVEVGASASASARMQTWTQAQFDERVRVTRLGEPVPNYRYELIREDGSVIAGVTDSEGWTEVQKGLTSEGCQIRLLGSAS